MSSKVPLSPGRAPFSGPTGQRVTARRREVQEILTSHGVTNIRVFGSVARGDDDQDSDVDLLVDFARGTSLFTILRIQDLLERLLEAEVDLVSNAGLKARMRPTVEADAIPL